MRQRTGGTIVGTRSGAGKLADSRARVRLKRAEKKSAATGVIAIARVAHPYKAPATRHPLAARVSKHNQLRTVISLYSLIGVGGDYPPGCREVMVRQKLKVAILLAGRTQRSVAREIQMSEDRLSEIVQGMVEPRDCERQAIAAALGLSPDGLFDDAPEDTPTSASAGHMSTAEGGVVGGREAGREKPTGLPVEDSERG